MKTLITALAVVLATGSLAFADEVSHAGEVGFHPATLHGHQPAIDASSLRYGHPASPLNGAEPAELVVSQSGGAAAGKTSRTAPRYGTASANRLEVASSRR